MRFVYKISTIILILVMTAIYPLSFVASIWVGAAGQNSHFVVWHYLFFGYSIVTAASLYYDLFVLHQDSSFRFFFRRLSIICILITIGMELYFMYSYIFVFKEFQQAGLIEIISILLFVLNTVLVLVGLLKNKF